MRLPIELARPGLADNGQLVSQKDLDEIVETFGDIGEAPITLGHPKGSSPRFGKVIAVTRKDDADGPLYAATLDLDDRLAKAYKEGFFTSWSLGAKRRPSDGKRYLHHLAFLGGVPPALKKLRTLEDLGLVELSDDDAEGLEELTFSDPNPTATPMADDNKTPKPGAAAADPANPQAAAEDPAQPKPKGDGADDVRLSDEVTGMRRQMEAMRVRERKAQLGSLRTAMSGRLPKPVQDQILELADQAAQAIDGDDAIELSDAEGAKTKHAFIEAVTAIVEQIPQAVRPGEIALGDVAETPESERVDYNKMAQRL